MGVLPAQSGRPASGSGKGPAIPGQNVGMEQIGDPDGEKSASKGMIVGNKPGGDAADIVIRPNWIELKPPSKASRNKPGGNDVGMEVGDGGDPDDERSASKVVPSVTPALRKNPVGMAPPVEQEVRR